MTVQLLSHSGDVVKNSARNPNPANIHTAHAHGNAMTACACSDEVLMMPIFPKTHARANVSGGFYLNLCW